MQHHAHKRGYVFFTPDIVVGLFKKRFMKNVCHFKKTFYTCVDFTLFTDFHDFF